MANVARPPYVHGPPGCPATRGSRPLLLTHRSCATARSCQAEVCVDDLLVHAARGLGLCTPPVLGVGERQRPGRESGERSADINTAMAKHVYCSIQPPHWRLPRQILLEDVIAIAVGVAALCCHLQAMAMPPVALLWPPKPHYRSRLFGSSPRRYVHHLPLLMRSASCGGQADGPCARVCFSMVVDSKPTQAVENVVCGEDVGGARGQRDEGGPSPVSLER